jgi:hypothetical protein
MARNSEVETGADAGEPRARGRLRGWSILSLLVVGAVGAVVIITAAFYFDQFTEGNYFCGVLCHPNRPEWVTHEVSSHAEVECGECHVGPGLLPKVTAKIFGVQELIALVTNSYSRPIEPPVERLRPAQEICEQCHWPAKFYGDRVVQNSHFASDESNSESLTYLILRTGGGDMHPLEGPAIHWHIDNPVYYVARDAERQDIPWVGVQQSDGALVEYVSVTDPLTAEERDRLPRRTMDCLDCHNRATHRFEKPENSVDDALTSGRLDSSLPFIKREAVDLLSASYSTHEEGIAAMNQLDDFYSAKLPAVYSEKKQQIADAVAMLQEIYGQTVFPSMNVTWQAYADNIGHADFAGCFRCHEGQHLSADGESIRLHCSICHSIPVVTRPGQQTNLASVVSFITQARSQPESHKATNFIRDHRFLANDSCTECHGTIEFGTDNSSFCANEACHGRQWPQADLDAAFPHPVPFEGKHAQVWCNDCHEGVAKPANIEDCASCHEPPQQPHFGPQCADCHSPVGWGESVANLNMKVSPVPHPVLADLDCALCHGEGKTYAAPPSHIGISNTACDLCHQVQVLVDVPPVPHTVEDRSNCLACHAETGLAPVPPDHRAWTNQDCLVCHKRPDQ